MDSKYKKIWKLALPYLENGGLKNLVIHTGGVVKAMELILKREKGDRNILIPAAILHDVGWAKVPKNLQTHASWKNKRKLRKAMELHLEYAPPIISKILKTLNFKSKDVDLIADIVKEHKYKHPKNKDKRLLIDADNLSDIFKKQFWSDVKEYEVSPKKQYGFRRINKFYSETAKNIFGKELNKRKKEVGI